jgi:hypothetical protein
MFGISEFPDGVTVQFHRFSTRSPENKEWSDHFLGRDGYLEKAIKGDILKAVPANVLGGLESASEGLDKVHSGVSGQKIVIQPWA